MYCTRVLYMVLSEVQVVVIFICLTFDRLVYQKLTWLYLILCTFDIDVPFFTHFEQECMIEISLLSVRMYDWNIASSISESENKVI